MHVERLESSPALGHAPAQWLVLTESAAQSIPWLRSRKWYDEATSAIAMVVQLGLLLSTAALLGLFLGIVL